MKQVKCPYCGNKQEATYDKRTKDDWQMNAFEKFFGKTVPVCTCKKCGEGFKELENKVESEDGRNNT